MSKRTLATGIAVALALLVVAYFFLTQNFAGLLPPPANSQTNVQTSQPNAADSVVTQDIKVGTGAIATVGSSVQVNYIGKLQNGTVFDQSSSHGGPFTFTLGAGQVIPGWDQGVQGMKVGGERLLIIPPSLGYGAQPVGPIPANSTLVFDVQLVGVSTASSAPAVQ